MLVHLFCCHVALYVHNLNVLPYVLLFHHSILSDEFVVELLLALCDYWCPVWSDLLLVKLFTDQRSQQNVDTEITQCVL